MIKSNDICVRCGRGCDNLCKAIKELQAIYNANSVKEKRQLIHRLKNQLGIIDAEPAKDLSSLAKKIIKKIPELHHIIDFNINIGYVRSYESKTKGGKLTYADCRKVNKVYGAYLPFDFIITFYEPNIDHLSDNQIKILMWHELKHIGVGERGFVIEPHDIEDFYAIIDIHGTKWDELGVDVINILE